MKKTAKPRPKILKPDDNVEHEYTEAMEGLVQDVRFVKFIDALRFDRENCVLELSRYDVMECERKTLALIGTIGAYTDIIGRFDTALARLREQRLEEVEQVA